MDILTVSVLGRHSRSRVDTEGSNFIVAPAHGLEGRVVISDLPPPTQEVLLLVDRHATLPVVL